MIDIKDVFKIAMRNLSHRKKRTFLTIIGIIIGISSVVALVSIGQGLSYSINMELEKIGADKLFVQAKAAGGAAMSGEDAASRLTTDDKKLIDKVLGVKRTTGFLAQATKVGYGKSERTTYIYGYPEDSDEADLMDKVNTWEVDEGRMLIPGEKGKVVIGRDIAETMFDKEVEIGNKISCDGKEYKVIGIFKKIGDPGLDKGVLAGEDDVREQYNEPDLLSYIYVQTDSEKIVEDVGEKIERAMRKDRGLKEGQEDFSVQTPMQMVEIFTSVLNIVTVVLIGIAAISLLVGGIGIMNTMYTSVLERTKEIGIMKAIGAKNNHILILFLVESGILGLVGGAIGVGIGFLGSKIVEVIAANAIGTDMLKAFFPWYLGFGALMFSFIVGTLSGIFPAKRASSLKPVDALRYE